MKNRSPVPFDHLTLVGVTVTAALVPAAPFAPLVGLSTHSRLVPSDPITLLAAPVGSNACLTAAISQLAPSVVRNSPATIAGNVADPEPGSEMSSRSRIRVPSEA